MSHHDPFPDEPTASYEYAGSPGGLALPNGDHVAPGETVALPDRIADHIDDLLVPLDTEAEDDEDAESGDAGEASADEADGPADEGDAGVCTATLDSGEECGRELPCQYHSDAEDEGGDG